MAFTEDDATAAVDAVALYTNRDAAFFTIARGDVARGLIMVCADISSTGQVGACYVYSLNTKRVYSVSSVEEPDDVFAVIAERDAT